MLTRWVLDTTPISIHSPRMGRDRSSRPSGARADNFNPLSPHGERLSVMAHTSTAKQFQSTLPAWGETFRICAPAMYCSRFQSTLPAWGETRIMARKDSAGAISIHSPRMGRDPRNRIIIIIITLFQSTLPAWGETRPLYGLILRKYISIHSPRMGRDIPIKAPRSDAAIISIHSPRMGRDEVTKGH